MLVPAVALALPQGGQVTARSASIAHTGNTLTVTQTSGKTAIDWQGFSIGAGQSVKFRQPGAIIAQGGVVLLSASAKAALLRTVVSETGLVEAGSAVSQRGTITLPGGASGAVAVSGTLDAHSSAGAGGSWRRVRSAAGRSRCAAARWAGLSKPRGHHLDTSMSPARRCGQPAPDLLRHVRGSGPHDLEPQGYGR